MHVQTHLLAGWIGGNLPDLTPRERFLCMAAAAAPDLDGLGLLVSSDLYQQWHHVLGHNLAFGLLLSGILAALSARRGRAFGMYLACLHSHLVMDYWGSGPGWDILYFWPFSLRSFGTADAWDLSSWQNYLAGGICVALSLWIALVKGRTPLEWMAPRWDAGAMEGIRGIAGRFRRA